MTASRNRRTLHLARPEDALEVRRLPHESEDHFAKRCASIRALGVLWVQHQSYVFDPRHSTNPEVWKSAHAAWWKQVHEAAAKARARNPAYLRSQSVIDAMGAK